MKRSTVLALVLAASCIGAALVLYLRLPAHVPTPAPEVRISASSLVASSVPAASLTPLTKGTEIAAVASDAKMVLSVQVRPTNAAQSAAGASTEVSSAPAAGCAPVDLRIAISEDQNGTPRAAVTDLNGGTVQAHLDFLAAAPKRNWRVGAGLGLDMSAEGPRTLYSASVARRVQERTWLRLDASKRSAGLSMTVSAEYEF